MPADLDAILKLEVPVIVQIASREMRVEEVRGLTPGSIIELPKVVEEELEIMVSDKPIGTGTAVKVGENFGVRVTYVGDVRERIAALGGKDAADAAGDDSSESPDDQHQPIAEQILSDE